jgi:hypothetical protein
MLAIRTLKSAMAVLLLVATATAYAHHSASALFNMDEMASVEGVVTEVWFQNPHSRYYVEVSTESGETELWEIETMSPNWFLRRGWDEETVVVGMHIRVEGHLARNGSNRMLLRILQREGEEIYRWIRPASPVLSL